MSKPSATIEISAKSKADLVRLASRTGLKPSEVVELALERYQEDIDDVAEDERRWAQYERDGKAVSGGDVKAWIDSWGSTNELPMPKP